MLNKRFMEVEEKLSIVLPEFYKTALINYPFTPIDSLDFVEDNLVKEHDWIIDSNLELRKCGFFGCLWPSRFFAIGHD